MIARIKLSVPVETQIEMTLTMPYAHILYLQKTFKEGMKVHWNGPARDFLTVLEAAIDKAYSTYSSETEVNNDGR